MCINGVWLKDPDHIHTVVTKAAPSAILRTLRLFSLLDASFLETFNIDCKSGVRNAWFSALDPFVQDTWRRQHINLNKYFKCFYFIFLSQRWACLSVDLSTINWGIFFFFPFFVLLAGWTRAQVPSLLTVGIAVCRFAHASKRWDVLPGLGQPGEDDCSSHVGLACHGGAAMCNSLYITVRNKEWTAFLWYEGLPWFILLFGRFDSLLQWWFCTPWA